MTRAWIGIALLAASWLFGLGYYQPAHWPVWAGLVAGAVWLLGDAPRTWRPGLPAWLAAILLLLPAGLAPWPYRSIPLLLAAGLVLTGLPVASPGLRRWGIGSVAAAVILLVQALALEGYQQLTARAHELPWPLAQGLAWVARILGLETALDGSWLVLGYLEQPLRVAATWDLLVDASLAAFLAGGIAWIWFFSPAAGTESRRRLADVGRLFAILAVWAPWRAGLLIGLFLHRALRADGLSEPNVADIFVNSWLSLLGLAGPAYLAARILRRQRPAVWSGGIGAELASESWPTAGGPRHVPWLAPLAVAAGVALLGWGWYWVPVGQAQAGRVLVVERHSTWEPTTTPYGTTVYGEAGSYNYAAAYEYCSQYFAMSRLLETEPIDDRRLAECDVLVIKTPTSRYTEDEVAAVGRFVRRGGGLLLIGDHTNVFNMNTCLNDIARDFGFSFRNDLLFRVGSPYRQQVRPPLVPHPIVQHVPPMNFAVSCSIDPGRSGGRMAVRSLGLWSLPPAYHESNYHPQAEYRSHMQYGAWCQMWSTTSGRGRVVGFADSTLFSNFCVYQPGKAELLRGMLDWLNHRSRWDGSPARGALLLPLAGLGVVLLAWGVWIGHRPPAQRWLLVAAGYGGWAVTAWAVAGLHRHALPVPPVQRPLPHVVIDRTVSEVPLHTGAFADDKEGLGYGLLEQWIPRIGNRISRAAGADVWSGDGLVILCPTRSVSDAYQQRLSEFVAAGGRLLVIDSPDVSGSTANSLLRPFRLTSTAAGAAQNQGALTLSRAPTAAAISIQASCRIDGGEPLAYVNQIPVAAQIRHGRGLVTAVGFGSLFNDAAMGFHWLPEPEPELRERYEFLYALLRAALPYRQREPAAP